MERLLLVDHEIQINCATTTGVNSEPVVLIKVSYPHFHSSVQVTGRWDDERDSTVVLGRQNYYT